MDEALLTAGFAVHWIGTQTCNAASWPPTWQHEGINGDTYAGKITTMATLYGVGNPNHGVRVLIVNLGTNAEPSGTYTGNAMTFLSFVHTNEPQCLFVMVKQDAGSFAANNAALFNPGGICDQLAALGASVYRAVNTGSPPLIHPTDFLADALHENPGGYVKVGINLAPAVLAALQGLPPGNY